MGADENPFGSAGCVLRLALAFAPLLGWLVGVGLYFTLLGPALAALLVQSCPVQSIVKTLGGQAGLTLHLVQAMLQATVGPWALQAGLLRVAPPEVALLGQVAVTKVTSGQLVAGMVGGPPV